MVPEIDDEGGEPDDQQPGMAGHQPERDELARSRETTVADINCPCQSAIGPAATSAP